MYYFCLNCVYLQIGSDHFFSCCILWQIWNNSINFYLWIEFIFSLNHTIKEVAGRTATKWSDRYTLHIHWSSHRLWGPVMTHNLWLTCCLSCPSRYHWLVRFLILCSLIGCWSVSLYFWPLCYGFNHRTSFLFESCFCLTRVRLNFRSRPIWWLSLPFILLRCKKLLPFSSRLFWGVFIMSAGSWSWHF